MGNKLGQDEKVQVYAAIAHVISAMPMAAAAESLRTFALDILSEVHAMVNNTSVPSKDTLQSMASK